MVFSAGVSVGVFGGFGYLLEDFLIFLHSKGLKKDSSWVRLD